MKTWLQIRPASPVCLVYNFLPIIWDEMSRASSGLEKRINQGEEKRRREKNKQTKKNVSALLSITCYFRDGFCLHIRVNNSDAALQSSLKCPLSSASCQNLSFYHQVFSTWEWEREKVSDGLWGEKQETKRKWDLLALKPYKVFCRGVSRILVWGAK